MDQDPGCPPPAAGLYVVAPPIGNRADLSARARETLASCDRIACENTPSLRRLLQGMAALPPSVTYHEGNEAAQAERVADWVADGQRVALVSEAGTPGVSDPGFRAVRACRRRGLPVFPVPGPCAVVAALSVSGLPSDGFLFLGFLPAKRAARLHSFERFRDFPYTVIYYESTHRILAFLEDLGSVVGGERCVFLGRELTKMHETTMAGPLEQVRASLAAGSRKGEFVVCVAKPGYAL